MLRFFRDIALCFALLLGVVQAVYGQAPQQNTPQVQALANRLTAEINNNLTCTANVITLQEQIKKLNVELAEARKAEPTKTQDRAPEKKKP